MRRLLRDFSMLLLAALAFGCSEDVRTLPPLDTDAGTVPTAPTYQLELEAEAMAALRFGESVELAVRYLDQNRRPLVGDEVDFALLGSAHDSTLSDTDADTDEEGIARIAVTAGETVTGFQVRASALYAAPVFFDVAVSDNGFGMLEVTVTAAPEVPDAERWVAVRAGGSCTSPGTDVPDFEMRLRSGDAVVFPALPAGTGLAVIGEGRSMDGAVIASACRDEVELLAEERSELRLELEAMPLVTMGSYESRVAVAADDVGALFSTAVMGPAEASLEEAGGTVGLLLATLRDRLRSDPAALMLLDALEASGIARRLSSIFGDAGVGFEAALQSADADMVAELSNIAVEGRLRVGEPEGTTPAQVTFEVTAVYTHTDGHRLSMPVMAPTAELMATVDEDAIEVDNLALALSAAAVAESALTRDLLDMTGPEAGIALRASCGSWPGLRELADVCDERCVMELCQGGAARTWAMIQENLQGFGQQHSRIEFSGDLSFEDEDQDRLADRAQGELPGLWVGDSLSDGTPLAGTWEGTRILPME